MDFRRLLEVKLVDGVRSLGEFSSFCLNTVLHDHFRVQQCGSRLVSARIAKQLGAE